MEEDPVVSIHTTLLGIMGEEDESMNGYAMTSASLTKYVESKQKGKRLSESSEMIEIPAILAEDLADKTSYVGVL